MWFTDVFDNYALSQLVISNKSDGYSMWKKPTPKPLYKIHIFNYTNVEDFMVGLDKKLNVEELGPYVYEESSEKVDIEFHEDKVSYRVKRNYEFRPDLSKGKQSDQVTVPNMAVFTGAAMVQNQNYFARLGFAGLLAGMDVKPFLTVSAHSFIMGYDDKLFEMSKGFQRINNIDAPEKMGLLSSNVGVNKDELTVNTGKTDINRVGMVEEVNGETELDYFSTNECNRISATEGVNYPPNLIQAKKPVRYLFLPACRAMPMEFDEEVSILDGKVSAYKYKQPQSVFQTADEYPENQCYCSEAGACPPKGLINATACNLGAPLFISKPHFKGGDRKLAESIRGLQPNRSDLPESIVYVHPQFGYLMSGQTVIQVNIMVKKSYGIAQLGRFEADQVLPIAWFNVVSTIF
ncbi:unnamed protein product [Acanthoscelides obtectus]|uniref:Scavenger receptor class B member 1 n=1 Tax=Acanthoscelides obtectus TaxID=200917 RepID=A0A9P0KRQ3_ACAOB|nr:unnamed protein product [Acanthoscelides obtectus]CAK1659104.1 Scavenger receptor class B member 1 [Acanthoscelides obtectus]